MITRPEVPTVTAHVRTRTNGLGSIYPTATITIRRAVTTSTVGIAPAVAESTAAELRGALADAWHAGYCQALADADHDRAHAERLAEEEARDAEQSAATVADLDRPNVRLSTYCPPT